MLYKDEPTTRLIDRAYFRRIQDPLTGSDSLVGFRIRGNAFLHNMIRIIIGTFLDKSRGKISESLGSIIESKNRLQAGHTAPAFGLYLRHAYYPALFAANTLRVLPSDSVLRS